MNAVGEYGILVPDYGGECLDHGREDFSELRRECE